MKYLKLTLFTLALFLGATLVSGQVTIPYSFTSGTTIQSSQVNSNFSTLGDKSLNREGGTVTGAIASSGGSFSGTWSGTPTFSGNVVFSANPTFTGTGTGVAVTNNATVGGTLAVTGTTTFNSIAYTWPASQTASYYLQTNGSGTLSWATGGQTVQSITSTGTQNDLAVTAARHLILRANNASALTINGFAAGTDGDVIDVVSVGAGQVDFAHQNASSTAANRLINFVTTCVMSLAPGSGTARFAYDGTTARWRMIAHEQGAWITSTVTTETVTGGGTVTDSDSTNRYKIVGRTLFWKMYFSWTPTGTVTAVTRNLPIAGATSASFGFFDALKYGSAGTGIYASATTNSADTKTKFEALTAAGAVNFGSGSNSFQGTHVVELQ